MKLVGVSIKRLILMFQFMTTIPIPISMESSDEDFGKGLVFAPVVGLFIGTVLSGMYYLMSHLFPAFLSASITVIIYIVLTGGIHLDGLGDTFDGLFSNRSKERMLEIMRDSRVGTNAVLALICIILFNVGIISSVLPEKVLWMLLLMPVAGRIGSLVGAGVSGYARSGQGLGKSFIEFCGISEIAVGMVISLAIFYAVQGVTGLILCMISFISAFMSVKFFSRKIGGATGDILGAVCEINQAVFLLCSYLLTKI